MAVTRTEIVPNPGAVAVAVRTGQFLHFIVDAVGPMPIWSFASNVAGMLFQAPDVPGHPLPRYEWDHLKNPSDVQQLELLNLGLSFLTCPSDTFTVELHNAGGLMSTVLQIQYSGAPTDVASESFTVVIA
jgi:hypothetical protein